jgi:hypothetical protein
MPGVFSGSGQQQAFSESANIFCQKAKISLSLRVKNTPTNSYYIINQSAKNPN